MSENLNTSGPVTAMEYLHNVTKDWNNIPNMELDYIDEGALETGAYGYGGIKTTGNITIITNKNGDETGSIENLKARLPKFNEVYGPGRCSAGSDNNGKCPLWLTNYLAVSTYVSGPNLYNIKLLYGYWTLASMQTMSERAFCVEYNGTVMLEYLDPHYGFDSLVGAGIGVRPVITVPSNEL